MVRASLAVWAVLILFPGVAGIRNADQNPPPKPDSTKGKISGSVKDGKGAVLPGLTVSLTDQAGATVATTTDKEGNYSFPGLAPGAFAVSIVPDGFEPFVSDVINVASGAEVRVDATLKAAAPEPQQPPATPPVAAPPAAPPAPAPPSGGPGGGGVITGSVKDPSGASVPGVTVMLTDQSGVSQSTTTNGDGEYAFLSLAPGTFSLSVSAGGFAPFASKPVTLAAGAAARVDAALEVAAVSATASVTAQAGAQVETESSQVAGTITETELVKIGLNGRNFTQLIALAPGVNNQTGQDEAKVGVQGSVKYSVNGGRVEYNTFEVDGGDILNAGVNGADSTLIVYPSLDALSGVQVLTSNYGAQYGRTASGTILAETKSGGDQYHGDVYYFNRSEIFNARNFFDLTKSAPLYRKHDIGLTAGGPLYIPGLTQRAKSKTFFFISEEYRHEKEPFQYNAAVPSVAERSGDFSDVCPSLGTQIQVTYIRTKFPDCPGLGAGFNAQGLPLFNTFFNNQVFVNPISSAILGTNAIPLPNTTTGCNSTIGSCFTTTVSPLTIWREDLVRLDHDFSISTRLTLRYIHDNSNTTVPVPQWALFRNTYPTVQNKFHGPGHSALLRLTKTISTTLLNQVSFAFTTDHITLTNVEGFGGGTSVRPPALDTLGLGYLFNNGFGGKVTGIIVGGNNGAYGGSGFTADPAYMPWSHANPTYTIRDDVTKALGKHTLQFGATYVLSQRNEINPPVGSVTGELQGSILFSNVNNLKSTTGNSFADFLRGTSRSFTQDSAQAKYHQRYQLAEPYFQDDWKVTSRLTVNLGLRISLFGTYHEKYNNVFNWVPSKFDPALAATIRIEPIFGVLVDAATGVPLVRNPNNPSNLDPRQLNGLVQCGKNGVPSSCMSGHLFNPAPRIGFAWDLFGNAKTSLRAGYGIFFEHGTGNEANTGSLEGSTPTVLNMTQDFPGALQCIGGQPLPSCAKVSAGAYALNVTSIPTKAVWPYAQQWSFGVQQELPANFIAGVAYVGSKGTHLTAELQLNQLPPTPASLNPFLPQQPFDPIACGPTSTGMGTGFDGVSWHENGVIIGPGDPSYLNFFAACQGAVSGYPVDNALRTFAPSIGNIYALRNIANSSYNAMQFTLRRLSGPVTLGVSYTYSHALDNSSDRTDTTFVNSFDLNSNRASSNFDQRSALSISYVLRFPMRRLLHDLFGSTLEDTPAGGGAKPAASSAPPSAAGDSRWASFFLDNWEASGVTIFQSGTPFTVLNGASPNGISVLDNAGVANGVGAGSYPDVVGDPYGAVPNFKSIPGTFGPLLGNPDAFSAPRGLTFGNAGRNSLNNPRRTNFDFALLKHHKLRESQSLEFRFETFNLFNHTQFRIYNPVRGNVNNTIGCYQLNSAGLNTAGGGTCLAGSSFLHPVDAHRPRTIQLGLKFLF